MLPDPPLVGSGGGFGGSSSTSSPISAAGVNTGPRLVAVYPELIDYPTLSFWVVGSESGSVASTTDDQVERAQSLHHTPYCSLYMNFTDA